MNKTKAVELAREYCHLMGRPYVAAPRLVADKSRGEAIAAEYQAAASWDWRALPYFEQFAVEIEQQYAFLTRHVVHALSEADPYPSHAELFAELDRRSVLVTWSTKAGDTGHPYLRDDQNDKFRFVHDLFGHYATRGDFSRHGEEMAWYSHAQMFGPVARRAMTTDTRGQNSTMIWALGGNSFPEQKVTILSPEFSDLRNITLA